MFVKTYLLKNFKEIKLSPSTIPNKLFKVIFTKDASVIYSDAQNPEHRVVIKAFLIQHIHFSLLTLCLSSSNNISELLYSEAFLKMNK